MQNLKFKNNPKFNTECSVGKTKQISNKAQNKCGTVRLDVIGGLDVKQKRPVKSK